MVELEPRNFDAYRDRRQVPRVKTEVTVQYKIKKIPQTEGFEVSVNVQLSADISRTRDLSEKGMLFTARGAILEQSTLEIKLRLPIQVEPVDLEGRVVSYTEIMKEWIYGIRVEFVKVEDEARDSLRRFVKNRL